MSLLGSAALAMWWDIAPGLQAEFEDWHSHEHFVERLAIPGFRRGSRWASATGGEGFFVMYELTGYETLTSAPYLAHLNAPTPWSTKMMPHHRNMVRSQCRVVASHGSGVGRHALTVRLSAQPGRDDAIRASLTALVDAAPSRPGIVGAHLLRHSLPDIGETTEQKIRGGDKAADWAFVACGYDLSALERIRASDLATEALLAAGVADGAVSGLYTLSHSATPSDAT